MNKLKMFHLLFMPTYFKYQFFMFELWRKAIYKSFPLDLFIFELLRKAINKIFALYLFKWTLIFHALVFKEL